MTAVQSYYETLTWRPRGSISAFLRESSKSLSLVGSAVRDMDHDLPRSSEDVLLRDLIPDLYNQLNSITQEQSLQEEEDEQCGLEALEQICVESPSQVFCIKSGRCLLLRNGFVIALTVDTFLLSLQSQDHSSGNETIETSAFFSEATCCRSMSLCKDDGSSSVDAICCVGYSCGSIAIFNSDSSTLLFSLAVVSNVVRKVLFESLNDRYRLIMLSKSGVVAISAWIAMRTLLTTELACLGRDDWALSRETPWDDILSFHTPDGDDCVSPCYLNGLGQVSQMLSPTAKRETLAGTSKDHMGRTWMLTSDQTNGIGRAVMRSSGDLEPGSASGRMRNAVLSTARNALNRIKAGNENRGNGDGHYLELVFANRLRFQENSIRTFSSIILSQDSPALQLTESSLKPLSRSVPLLAALDSLGRVLVLDCRDCVVLGMLKGCRNVEIAWVKLYGRKAREVHGLVVLSVTRNLVEIWDVRIFRRVAVFKLRRDCGPFRLSVSRSGVYLIDKFGRLRLLSVSFADSPHPDCGNNNNSRCQDALSALPETIYQEDLTSSGSIGVHKGEEAEFSKLLDRGAIHDAQAFIAYQKDMKTLVRLFTLIHMWSEVSVDARAIVGLATFIKRTLILRGLEEPTSKIRDIVLLVTQFCSIYTRFVSVYFVLCKTYRALEQESCVAPFSSCRSFVDGHSVGFDEPHATSLKIRIVRNDELVCFYLNPLLLTPKQNVVETISLLSMLWKLAGFSWQEKAKQFVRFCLHVAMRSEVREDYYYKAESSSRLKTFLEHVFFTSKQGSLQLYQVIETWNEEETTDLMELVSWCAELANQSDLKAWSKDHWKEIRS